MYSNSTSISFDNTEIAFRSKSNVALQKMKLLFGVMNNTMMVKIGSAIMLKALEWRLPVAWLAKITIYDQFCGGTTLDKAIPVINALNKENIEVLLNYSVEGLESDEAFLETYHYTIKSIDFAVSNPSVRAVCIKFTGFGSIALFEKMQKKEVLNEEEKIVKDKAKEYIQKICAYAASKSIQLYVDAEESWIQDPIDEWADEMMALYNQKEPILFNTFQMYRNDKLAYLQKSIDTAKQKNYILGAKIVRGAYVEKENKYAQEHQILSPIHISKDATDKDFNQAMTLALSNLDNVSLCIASHNEYSNLEALRILEEMKVETSNKHICFSQLFGMGEHISYNISDTGYKVAKYLPYGPVVDVIPYLIRRAQENTSVEGQTSRELTLIKNELKRRKNG
jgi:proline dehydrogenase